LADEKIIELFTDGACRGNPGPGGWGALLRLGAKEKTICGGALATTNNRMELQAAIAGLAAIKKPSVVHLTTDSTYVRKGITEWMAGWKRNGISNDFLKDKPLFSEVADDFFAFCDGAELIIHNAPFDVGFINAEFRLLKFKTNDIGKHCAILDSLPLARQKHPGQANNLDALCKRYSVDSSGREYHGALLDAQLLAQVYLAMTSEQGSLFGGAAVESSQKSTAKKVNAAQPTASVQQYDLPVIKADDASVQAHQSFLKDVLKQD
jgi:DNA polymerase-3 subunit epsilon